MFVQIFCVKGYAEKIEVSASALVSIYLQQDKNLFRGKNLL